MRRSGSIKGLFAGVAAAALGCASCAGPGASPEAASEAALAARPVGNWKGVLEAGGTRYRVIVRIVQENGILSGTAASLDQGGAEAPLAAVEAEAGSLSFEVPSVGGRFAGRWDAARQAYMGEWSQPAGRIPLELTAGTFPLEPLVKAELLPADAFRYTPIAAAKARVGPTLPVGKCINMSNMLDAPSEGEWGPAIGDGDLAFIAKACFKTIRLPVRRARAMESDGRALTSTPEPKTSTA